MATKKYSDLLQELRVQSATKVAAAAKRAAEDPKSVPEKDPADKGTTSVPTDPDATTAVLKLPASSTNAEQTPVYSAPGAKVIDGPEKAAAMAAKVARTVSAIQSLLSPTKAAATKAAGGTAAEISTQGSLPSDAGNDNKNNKGGMNAPKPSPAHGTADPAVKESGKETTQDKTQTTAPMPPTDSKGPIPDDAKNTEKDKMASSSVDLTHIDSTFLYKLAHICLQFEDGRAMMETCLKRTHGAEHAQNLIKAATFMEQQYVEAQALAEAGASQAEEFWRSASETDRAGLLKLAAAHDTALRTFATQLEREAYLDGAKIAAALADSGMTGEQPPPGVPGMGGEGDPAAAPGAEGGEVSDDDILQALQILIQQGKITEEEAEAIVQQLLGGAGGAGGAGAGGADPMGGAGPGAGGAGPDAAGGPPAGGGGPPADAATPEDKEAAAQLKTVGQAVDALIAQWNK